MDLRRLKNYQSFKRQKPLYKEMDKKAVKENDVKMDDTH